MTGILSKAKAVLSTAKWETKLSLANRDLSDRIVFILSTGRTGTKFFEGFLNDHYRDIFAVHEPSPDLFDITINKHRKKHTSLQVRQAIHRARGKILKEFRTSGKRLYVEANPNASFLIPELAKLYPKARFIWITRDPKSYMCSAYSKSPLDDGVLFYSGNDHRKRLNGVDFGEMTSEEWKAKSRFERIAWLWSSANILIQQSLHDNGNWMHVSFEDLFQWRKPECISRIEEFLGISKEKRLSKEAIDKALSVKRNATSKKLLSDPGEWSADEMDSFQKEVVRASKIEQLQGYF